MKGKIHPHPSPLPNGEGTRLLALFSLGRRVGDESQSYLYSATPRKMIWNREYSYDI
jgi:hypothetical protein